MITVLHTTALQDNYIWLICVADQTIIIDPGETAPVTKILEQNRLTPAAIFCTHHHQDHTAGAAELSRHYDIPVYGPVRDPIPAVTHQLYDGDSIQFGKMGLTFQTLDMPGHTLGQIAFYGHGLLFCGDTLFSAGCGRLREGTAEQLHASLSRLAALPEDTLVYCGHEYTQLNLRFALTVDPANAEVREYASKVDALRSDQQCTLPSTIGLERRINPFLRTRESVIAQAAQKFANRPLNSETEVFATLRRWKDHFR